MADEKTEPSGFTEHTRSLAGEYAHEQGWGLLEEERTRQPDQKQDFEGGLDYEYGARDFGDSAIDTSAVQPSPESVQFLTKGAEPLDLGDSEQNAQEANEKE